jgi:NAD(P)-dependent dehydrogenase (short-subunit alcohol dehydrogenase family)
MSWTEQVDLGGRVAVVTGASEGIGEAVAAALARAGASVVVTSRSQERAEATAARLGDRVAGEGAGSGSSRGEVVGIACDVRSFEACSSLAAAVREHFGRLDVLVNNAGLGVFKPVQEMSVDEWQLQVETNLNGVFFTTKACLPLLQQAGNGGEGDAWLINVGSLASRNSFGRGAGYNASKFGLLGMTEAMMLDLRYDGIRTSIIMPGSVNTGFGGHDEDRQWTLQPDDVARAVLQLIAYPTNALVSRVEMRPSRPPRAG